MPLLERLVEEQVAAQLSDRAFARRLGVSQALWSITRARKVSIGKKLLAAVSREFPALREDVLQYLAVQQPTTPASPITTNDPEQS